LFHAVEIFSVLVDSKQAKISSPAKVPVVLVHLIIALPQEICQLPKANSGFVE
jgi:hypothetical protein